jgi:surfeit locus 1 family protein
VIGRIFSLPGILIVVVLYSLISLGFWQLDRADEKQAITQQIIRAQSMAPEKFSSVLGLTEKEHHSVMLEGHYISDRQFLYDNQIVNSNAGYYVMTPFILSDQKAVLINRGFVPWQGRRDRIANIALSDRHRIIKVSLVKPVKRIELDMDVSEENKKFPLLIQSLDINQIESFSKLNFSSMIGQLDKSSKDGFFRQWQPFYGSADKHLGYALQWFLMALALFIIALRLLIKR